MSVGGGLTLGKMRQAEYAPAMRMQLASENLASVGKEHRGYGDIIRSFPQMVEECLCHASAQDRNRSPARLGQPLTLAATHAQSGDDTAAAPRYSWKSDKNSVEK